MGEVSDRSHLPPVKRGKDELTFYKSLQIKRLQLEWRGVFLLFQTGVLSKEAADARLC